jgi:hypothetical protein
MTTDPNQIPQNPQEPTEPPQTPPPYQSGQSGQSGEPAGTPPPPPGAAGPNDAYGSYRANDGYGAYGQPGAPPPTGGSYAYAAPGPPQPAGMAAIWQKWINVTTRPGVASFAQELPTANWRDIWLSLIGLAILSAITGAIAALYTSQTLTLPRSDGTMTTVHFPAGASWLTIITVPLAFFVGVAILFVIAKIFGGTGTFLEQSYAMALYYVPIQGVIALLGLLPFLGGLAAFVLGIYEIVLAVFAIAASQRLTVGRSVAVVLLPAVILFLLVCGLIAVLVPVIATTLNGPRG